MPSRPDSEPLHPDCVAAVEATGRTLESLGHQVEISHPRALEEAEALRHHFLGVVSTWAAATLDWVTAQLGTPIGEGDVEPGTWALARQGRELGAAQYIQVGIWLESFTRRVAEWWQSGFDLLVTPTLALPPPPLGYLRVDPDDPEAAFGRVLSLMAFTPQFNVTGQPALSLPLHQNAEGLPIGVQLIAAYPREDLLLRVASQLEGAMPWADRRAPLAPEA